MARERFVMVRVPASHPLVQPRGRLNALDPKSCDDIVRDVEAGTFKWVAAALAGVSKPRFNSWLRRGAENITEVEEAAAKGVERDYDDYGLFVLKLQRAEASSRQSIERDVANSDDDRVKLKFLEMRYGKTYHKERFEKEEATEAMNRIEAGELLREKITKIIQDRGDDSVFEELPDEDDE